MTSFGDAIIRQLRAALSPILTATFSTELNSQMGASVIRKIKVISDLELYNYELYNYMYFSSSLRCYLRVPFGDSKIKINYITVCNLQAELEAGV